MFDSMSTGQIAAVEPGGSIAGTTALASEAALTTAELAGWVEALTRLDTRVDDDERIDQLRALERVKAAHAAAQARVTTAFAASQRVAQRAAGVKPRDIGKGIGAQVALARMDSRFKGGRHLGLAEALVQELPHTLAALSRGETSEWRATLVARETACLSPDDRRSADAELADRLPEHGASARTWTRRADVRRARAWCPIRLEP